MKKKRIIIVGIVFLVLLIVVFLITSSVTLFEYQKEHIMIYPPTDEEQVELAHDMGLILSSDVHIDAAMLCRAREDVNSGYSVRVTGVDDAYVFLSENINIIDSIRKEDETLYINENPISFDNEVVKYYFLNSTKRCQHQLCSNLYPFVINFSSLRFFIYRYIKNITLL